MDSTKSERNQSALRAQRDENLKNGSPGDKKNEKPQNEKQLRGVGSEARNGKTVKRATRPTKSKRLHRKPSHKIDENAESVFHSLKLESRITVP